MERRVTIPGLYRKEMGARIKRALLAESKRRTQKAQEVGIVRHDNITTIKQELFLAYGIEPAITNVYLSGNRQIPLQDIRALAQYTGLSIEDLTQDAPLPTRE